MREVPVGIVTALIGAPGLPLAPPTSRRGRGVAMDATVVIGCEPSRSPFAPRQPGAVARVSRLMDRRPSPATTMATRRVSSPGFRRASSTGTTTGLATLAQTRRDSATRSRASPTGRDCCPSCLADSPGDNSRDHRAWRRDGRDVPIRRRGGSAGPGPRSARCGCGPRCRRCKC